MSTAPRPTKADRRDEARAAALALREEQERAARRQRTVVIASAVAGIAILGILVAFVLGQANASALGDVAAPAGSTASGAIPVGPDGVAGSTDGAKADAVVVSVYSDFMCPLCGFFEEVNGPTLDRLREAGDVVVEYHPVSILDRTSQGSQYSTRAVNAAAVVADQAPEAFLPFLKALFAEQPEEGTTGLGDDEIARRAVEAGVPQAVADTFVQGEFTDWAGAATEQASKDLGRLGTPTVLLDGEKLGDDVDWRVEGALEDAIAAAQG